MVLAVELGQLRAGLLFRLLDGEEQVALVVVQFFQVDAHVAVAGRVLQVDDVRDHGAVLAVAGPAVVLRLQLRPREAWRRADGRGQVGRHLQVQHFLDEDAEDDIEGFLLGQFGAGRGAHARPLAAFIIGDAFRVDLVRALDRIHGGHVQGNGEQFHANGRLGDGAHGGRVGGQHVERTVADGGLGAS
ncbi:hypothetical protein D3C72_1789370 [compost metagenome]